MLAKLPDFFFRRQAIVKFSTTLFMKKIFFALAIIISCASFISCDADSLSGQSTQMKPNAGDSGGTGTVPPVKPPPPPGTDG